MRNFAVHQHDKRLQEIADTLGYKSRSYISEMLKRTEC